MTPEDVLSRIDRQELIDLALALGNIDSPNGSEGAAGQFVYEWLDKNNFAPKKFALTPNDVSGQPGPDGPGCPSCTAPRVPHCRLEAP